MVGFVQPVIDIVGEVKSKIEAFASWLGSLKFANPFAGLGGGTSIPGTTVDSHGFVGGAQAFGTLSAPGGITLVGERGPELVSLPVGSRVWSNADTRSMLGGGEAIINMGPVYMNDKLDVEQVAYRVATILSRRRR
jgi:hypothetical protein